MFDIGLPEFAVIAVVALIVFGPDRLPRAAAEAGRLLKQLRKAADSARAEVTAAAGMDAAEVDSAVADLRSLHPRNLLADDAPAPPSPSQPAVRPTAPTQADPDWL